jgi:hypothetical protein
VTAIVNLLKAEADAVGDRQAAELRAKRGRQSKPAA